MDNSLRSWRDQLTSGTSATLCSTFRGEAFFEDRIDVNSDQCPGTHEHHCQRYCHVSIK